MSIKLIVALYVVVLALCTGLLIFSMTLGPSAEAKLFPIAADAFKTALGALIGVLSSLAGVGHQTKGGTS